MNETILKAQPTPESWEVIAEPQPTVGELKQQLCDDLVRSEASELDNVERWRILQRAHDIAFEIRRRSSGRSPWPVVGFGMISAVVLVGIYVWQHPSIVVYSAYGTPQISVRVLKQFNAYDFRLQKVVDGVAEQPASWHFCHDYKPAFEQGFTLDRLAFYDKNGCVEIGPIDRAYTIVRGPDDWPKIPRNCQNFSHKPVECDGEPQF